GLPVPPGFTLPVACCAYVHAHGGAWPEGLDAEVRDAVARLERVTGRRFGAGAEPLLVAVRSGATVSMPGMMDTLLNCGLHPGLAGQVRDPDRFRAVYAQFARQFAVIVGGLAAERIDDAETWEQVAARYEQHTGRMFPRDPWDALRECIGAVFRSWHNERAVVYRRAHDLTGLAGTAVTVQAMFPSQVAGVAFTANPARPAAGEIVIESAYGLGESIVSGDVTPDRFVLESDPVRITERTLGHKASRIAALGDATEQPDPDAPSLTDPQVLEIAELALRVERHVGHPVDIEWGLAAGRAALLQARPIRGLDVARDVEVGRREEIERLRAAADGRDKVWLVHNLAETLPAPTPMTWDILRQFMSGDGGFGRMYRDLGYRPSRRVREEGFLELIGGRIYADVDRAAELFWEGMPFTYDHDAVLGDPRLLETAPRTFDATRADGRFLLRLPGTIVGMIRAGRRMKRARARAADRYDKEIRPAFRRYVDDAARADLVSVSTPALLKELDDRIARVLTEFGGESLKPGFFGGIARAELEALLVQLLGPAEGARLCLVLTGGLDGDPTVEQSARLFAVSRGEATLEEVVQQYGHRAVNEMELAAPRYREDDRYLRRIVAAQATDEAHNPLHLHRRNRHRRIQATADLPDTLARRGGSFLRDNVLSRVHEAQRLLPYREVGKDDLLRGYELIRRALLELGRRWGIGDDVFFLRRDEWATYEGNAEALAAEIARRKVRRQALQRLDLPDAITSRELDALGLPRGLEAAEALDATPLSPGVFDGTARIVRAPTEATDLGEGCVLVCPSTDPSWTALFTTIKALVVERGGVLSHGAITARDFSIPAVACPDATRLIRDGAAVRVDGDRGRVSIEKE
ncbi:MAG: PEP/pyruvate-binding domain-containing protein, partial [Planctomycetota bacterium]